MLMTKRAVIVIGMVAVIFWIVLPSVANSIIAQSSYSIYPVYDEYIKNPDGALTLSFAYFSPNREPVMIPIGPNNAFSPGLAGPWSTLLAFFDTCTTK